MTSPSMFRPLAAALFAACVGLAALPGCGGSAPTKAENKEEPKPNPAPDAKANPNPQPKTDQNPGPSVPPKNTLGPVEPAADKAATAFLHDLVMGNAKVDMLSPAFVRVIGRPLYFPNDPNEKSRGFSPDAANSWLKHVGDGVTMGLELDRRQAGDVVYIRGGMSNPQLSKEKKTGGYSLRLVKEGGAWKVDWISLSSAELKGETPVPTPEAAAQEFAVVAFIQMIADLHGMPKEDRAPLIAASLTPELRKAWAPPFDQDTASGIDYNAVKIGTEATKIGGGTSSFTVARVGDLPEFKVELTKPAGKKTYTVKLTKGTRPNEWLVSEITESKG